MNVAEWIPPSEQRRRELLTAPFPRTRSAEIADRRRTALSAAGEHDADLLLVYGAERTGSAVPWLCSWPVTREAVLVIDAREGDAVLYVQFHNHVPLASEVADDCEVRWGGPSTEEAVAEHLASRDGGRRRLAILGPVRADFERRLRREVLDVVGLGEAYTRLRLTKSPAELDLLAVGAHLSDLAALALRDGVKEGTVDHEMADLVERAYVPLGGTTHIHYFGLTSMSDPDRGAPGQFTRGRRLQRGDVLMTELSAALEGYAGQVLRTMTLDEQLSPLYAELHEVADAAFDAVCGAIRVGAAPADLIDAAGVIEDAGYTIVDDLVHGFGGGYLPPILGSRSRPAGPLPDLVLEAGMTLVVQPNVTTKDHRAGVQTGELVVVTDAGAVSLHAVPRGPWLGVGQ